MGVDKGKKKSEKPKNNLKAKKGGIAKKKPLKSKIIPKPDLQKHETDANWKKFLEEQKKNPKPVPSERKPHFRKKKPKQEKEISGNPIWFDDVDPMLVEQECGVKANGKKSKQNSNTEQEKSEHTSTKLNDETVFEEPEKITKYVALDCEMVGVGYNGEENALARVSLVNSNCECIYDKFVKPGEKVVDYRTHVSGVRPSDLKGAPSYDQVQKEVADILKDKILVGHALQNDLKCLMLGHSRRQIRDTSKYKPFHKLLQTKRPALRKLVAKILHEEIQSGEHSSVIDARATMKIFKLHRKEWEKSIYCKKAKEEKKQEIFIGKEEKKKKRFKKFNNSRKKNK